MANYRTRICVCYLITTFLISMFVYVLISNNLQNNRAISRLREEVDEIGHMLLHSPTGEEHESRQLTELVDNLLKKRLAGIWDDLYMVKKQLKASECPSLGGSKRENFVSVEEKGVQRINYASDVLGAKIQDVKGEPVCGTNLIKSFLNLDFSLNPPVNMLKQSMEPGDCFAFKNSSVVTIKLANTIYVEAVGYEHICSRRSPTADITSAPKQFSAYALNSENPKSEILLGTFQYDNSATKRAQVFDVNIITKCTMVRFNFETNHGHPNYTCIYRIAVYGKP